jgi:hypothetical protein
MVKIYLSRMRMTRLAWYCCALCLLAVGPLLAYGQAPPAPRKPLLDLSGQVRLYTEVFTSSNPALSDQLMFELLGFKVSSSFNLGLPAGGFGVTRLHKPNLLQTWLHPQNNTSLDLKRGDLGMQLGTFRPQVSKLTAGNAFYVAGIGGKGKVLGISVGGSVGITQLEVGRNSSLNISGVFCRKMATAQLGWEGKKKNYFFLNFVRVRDDTTMNRLPQSQRPNSDPFDGSVVSVSVKDQLSKRISFEGELAISAFSDDSRAGALPWEVLPPELRKGIMTAGELFLFNSSTKLGLAHDLKVQYHKNSTKVGFKTEQRGASFQSMTFIAQRNDYRNSTLDFTQKLLGGRLQLQVEGGLQDNNLSKAKLTTMNQAIYRGNAQLQLFKALKIGFNAANFGTTMITPDSITGAIVQRQVNENYDAQASLSLGKRIQHNVMASASAMGFRDQVDGQTSGIVSNTRMVNIFYQVAFPSRLGINISFNGFQNDGFLGANQRQTLALGMQHQLGKKKKLNITGQLRYSVGQSDPSGTNNMVAFVGSARMPLTSKIMITVRCDTRHQEIGAGSANLQLVSLEGIIKF